MGLWRYRLWIYVCYIMIDELWFFRVLINKYLAVIERNLGLGLRGGDRSLKTKKMRYFWISPR